MSGLGKTPENVIMVRREEVGPCSCLVRGASFFSCNLDRGADPQGR